MFIYYFISKTLLFVSAIFIHLLKILIQQLQMTGKNMDIQNFVCLRWSYFKQPGIDGG